MPQVAEESSSVASQGSPESPQQPLQGLLFNLHPHNTVLHPVCRQHTMSRRMTRMRRIVGNQTALPTQGPAGTLLNSSPSQRRETSPHLARGAELSLCLPVGAERSEENPWGHSDSGNHRMGVLALGSFAHIFIFSTVKHHSLLVKLRCFRGFLLRNETH